MIGCALAAKVLFRPSPISPQCSRSKRNGDRVPNEFIRSSKPFAILMPPLIKINSWFQAMERKFRRPQLLNFMYSPSLPLAQLPFPIYFTWKFPGNAQETFPKKTWELVKEQSIPENGICTFIWKTYFQVMSTQEIFLPHFSFLKWKHKSNGKQRTTLPEEAFSSG